MLFTAQDYIIIITTIRHNHLITMIMMLYASSTCRLSAWLCSKFAARKDNHRCFSHHHHRRRRPPPRYSLAIARDVPSTFAQAVTKYAAQHAKKEDEPINVARTRAQKAAYLQALRRCIPTLCLPSLEEYPDSIFVEDTVVAIGKTAVITNPGHPSRRGEVDSISEILQQLGYEKIVDMRQIQDSAFCDGGDVLYTGRHLFVGLSERTNAAAVDVLTNVFHKDVHVQSVDELEDDAALHLKSMVTHLDEHTLLAPSGDLGDQVLKAMNASELGYEAIRLPSMLACNVVTVNGNVLAQHTGCEESKRILEQCTQDRGLVLEFVDMSEIAKADGALTCCSVLLQI